MHKENHHAVRVQALEILQGQNSGVLERYAGVVVPMRQDTNYQVRRSALVTINRPGVLTHNAGAVVHCLADEHGYAMTTEFCTLNNIQPTVRAQYTMDIVPYRVNANTNVRMVQLSVQSNLQSAALAPYSGDVLRLLAGDLPDETIASLFTLQQREPAVLAQYADEFITRLDHENSYVRCMGLHIRTRLTPLVWTEHAGAVVNILTDEDSDVRCSALNTLTNLEPVVPTACATYQRW